MASWVLLHLAQEQVPQEVLRILVELPLLPVVGVLVVVERLEEHF
jgi:hypothetical protein